MSSSTATSGGLRPVAPTVLNRLEGNDPNVLTGIAYRANSRTFVEAAGKTYELEATDPFSAMRLGGFGGQLIKNGPTKVEVRGMVRRDGSFEVDMTINEKGAAPAGWKPKG